MITRRTALKGAVAAALAAQPIQSASTMVDSSPANPDRPQLFGPLPYGPENPLALGEMVMLPKRAAQPLLAVEEISRRVLHRSDRLFASDGFGAEDLLRTRLNEEVDRYCAGVWSTYKQELRKVEALLRDAGVDHQTVHGAIGLLDEAAVNLFTEGHCSMLEVGLDAGKKIAHDYRTSLLFMPGSRTCPTCLGNGGLASPCPTCEGTCLVEPGPALMMIYLPDALMEAEGDTDAA